jgi:uncharacterized protein YkwD
MAIPPLIRTLCYTLPLISLFSFTRQINGTPSDPVNGMPPALTHNPPAIKESVRTSTEYPSSERPPFDMENDIFRLVNLHRRSMGLKPLRMNALESSLAKQHSQNMASGKTPFGHDGFKDRAAYLNKKMGPIRLAAENVASGQMSAREVVDGWLNSPGHRRNIEGDFKLTGIGLAQGRRGMIYFTQIFTR